MPCLFIQLQASLLEMVISTNCDVSLQALMLFVYRSCFWTTVKFDNKFHIVRQGFILVKDSWYIDSCFPPDNLKLLHIRFIDLILECALKHAYNSPKYPPWSSVD
jgi:hypothetical protein